MLNNKRKADSVIEFIKVTDAQAEDIKNTIMIKETEKNKYLPKQVVDIIQAKGYKSFTIQTHTNLWKNNGDSLKISKYGHIIAGKQWYWYDTWVKYVEEWCEKNLNK